MGVQNRKQITNLIIEWVREHRLSDPLPDPEITEETDLMAAGLLDSFGFIDLLLFVESQTGTKVDLTDVDPSEFTVVKGLCNIALSSPDNGQQQPVELTLDNWQHLPG
jgi:acyl carrier protein